MGSNRVTDPIAIKEQLHRILSSPEFDATARQKEFLRFVTHYYLTAGRRDRVRITIPKGSYVPSFLFQTGSDLSSLSPETEPNNNGRVDPWPSVLIRPFKSFSEGRESECMAEGCMTELAIELSRYQDIRVLMKPLDPEAQSIEEPHARF